MKKMLTHNNNNKTADNNQKSSAQKFVRPSSSQDQIQQLHSSIGNQTVQKLFEQGAIQAKLKIGKPNDKYEQEADRVADQIMRMPDTSTADQSHNKLSNKMPVIQRLCSKCEEEEDKLLQAKEMPGQPPAVSHELESTINFIRAGGQPISSSDRRFFESRFGQDFSQVRIHNDAQAANVANNINARAFTLGHNVSFAAGQYSPNTYVGRKLLAHELTHVVQQSTSSHLQQSQPAKTYATETINRKPTLVEVKNHTHTPIISRQLSASMCASSCHTPDGVDGPKGKRKLIIYADKEGSFLLLPATHKVGHSWLKLVDTTGEYWSYGFWPQSGYDIKKDVEGCVHHPDTAHKATSSQTFELTATEFTAAKTKAVSICTSKPKYNLFGLQCTEFVRRILSAAGKANGLGFGLIWESPNALDTWIRGNALLLGISVTGATTGAKGKGDIGLDIEYTHRFLSLLSNKLRFHWATRGELSKNIAGLSTGVGINVTSQRVYLPSAYLFGGGILGDLNPTTALGGVGERFGAGVTAGAGLLYNIDEIATVGVEYNLVKDFVNKDPVLHRFMLSARLRLW